MNTILRFLVVTTILSLITPSGVLAGAHGGQAASKIDELPVRSGDWSPEEVRKGREQLVRAFDAAWIRIIASGRDQEVIAKNPPNQPGAAGSYMVRLEDVVEVAEPVLTHRVITTFAAESEGISSRDVVRRLVEELQEEV